jgi:hypothetical protein
MEMGQECVYKGFRFSVSLFNLEAKCPECPRGWYPYPAISFKLWIHQCRMIIGIEWEGRNLTGGGNAKIIFP